MQLRSLVRWVRRRTELWTLSAALLVAASIWLFVALAGEVLEGETHGFDTAILLALRNPADPADPLGPGWLQEIGRDATAFGGTGVLVFVTAAVAIFLLMRGSTRSMIMVVAAVASGFLTSQLLKWGIDRPRPDLVPHGSFVYTRSFPSGHSMMAAVTYLTLATLVARVEKRRGIKIYLVALACIVTVLVGISRVYLGVHWPTDVLAGWTAGAAWALMWWLLAKWLEARGAVEPEEREPAPRETDAPPVRGPVHQRPIDGPARRV